jgi:hypothetical protein
LDIGDDSRHAKIAIFWIAWKNEAGAQQCGASLPSGTTEMAALSHVTQKKLSFTFRRLQGMARVIASCFGGVAPNFFVGETGETIKKYMCVYPVLARLKAHGDQYADSQLEAQSAC